MRELRRLGLAAVVAAAAAAPAFGQGGTTGGQGGTGGQSGQMLGNSNQSQIGGTQLSTQQQAPQLGLSSTGAASTNRAISTTNLFQQFYANPYYQGTYTNNKNNTQPGGFGQQSFGSTTSSGRGGTLGGQVGFGGGASSGSTATGVVSPSASAGGGRGGFGGGSSATGGVSVNLTDPGGQIAPLARQIAYPAVPRFDAPITLPTSVQTELRGMIDRSTMIANPAGVQLAYADGGTVVLRGTVRDRDEARTVEGMVRLTPGVRSIRNELTYPRP
jgi:hypothetical protein